MCQPLPIPQYFDIVKSYMRGIVMKDKMQFRNFIIYLFLAVFLVTGVGSGLDTGLNAFSACEQQGDAVFSIKTFTISRILHNFEARESNTTLFVLKGFQNNHQKAFGRNGLFFLFILAVFAKLFSLIKEILVLYDRLYVHERYHMITFMHDTDGRKRIS